MGWRERYEGSRAFERGTSRYSNPHNNGRMSPYAYDERRKARDWENGHREAEVREERRREQEDHDRRDRMTREMEKSECIAEYERQMAEREEQERMEAEQNQEGDDK